MKKFPLQCQVCISVWTCAGHIVVIIQLLNRRVHYDTYTCTLLVALIHALPLWANEYSIYWMLLSTSGTAQPVDGHVAWKTLPRSGWSKNIPSTLEMNTRLLNLPGENQNTPDRSLPRCAPKLPTRPSVEEWACLAHWSCWWNRDKTQHWHIWECLSRTVSGPDVRNWDNAVVLLLV